VIETKLKPQRIVIPLQIAAS
jgi:hypothetical protein